MGQFDLTNSLEAFRIYFNNDINNGSYNVALMGANGQQASGGASNGSMIYYEGSGTGSMSIKMDILDYTSSNKNAVSLHTISNPDSWVGQYVNRWLASTDPVTSVTLKCDLSTVAAGSVFSLYGVAG